MRIHEVAQWQGAVVARSALLPAGCRALSALAGDVLGVRPTVVPVSAEPSARLDGVANRAVLVGNRTAQLAALEAPEGPVLTIGGDCGVEVAPLGVARYRYGERLGVVWFDAHADLNTPDSSPSAAFHGMALRAAFGGGDAQFAASPAVRPGAAVLVGARSLDDVERAAVEAGLVTHLPVSSAREPARVADVVTALDVDTVYVHIDLDVLDPSEFDGMCYPEPGGMRIVEVAAGVRAVAERARVIGAGITECATDDESRLRRLVPVLDAIGAVLTV
jgi:arginase